MSFRVLLIRPNISVRKGFQRQNKMYPPLGLAYLAAPLLAKGYSVRIVDMVAEAPTKQWEYDERFLMYGMDDEDLRALAADFKPDLVGISCIIPQNPRMIDICEMFHAHFPGVPIALGGAHPSVMPEYCLTQTGANYVFKGDSEHTFSTFVDCLAEGRPADIDSIGGIVTRTENGFRNNPKAPIPGGLDSVRFPAWDLLPNASYLKHGISMPIITSRGCPYDCTFCCANIIRDRKWAHRSPENVVDEIQLLSEKYGYKNITIFDDAFNIQAKRAVAICKEIVRRELDIRIIIPSSLVISILTQEVIQWLAKAGCVALALPFEHVDENIRNKVIKKKLSTDHFENVLRWCREANILTVVNLVIGMPGESEQTLQAIVEYVKDNAWKTDALSVYVATPFPGTAFHDDLVAKGYLKNADRNRYIEYDLYECTYNTPWASAELVNDYKDRINAAFIEARGDIFDNEKIRTAIRRPNDDVVSWLHADYFPRRRNILGPELEIISDEPTRVEVEPETPPERTAFTKGLLILE